MINTFKKLGYLLFSAACLFFAFHAFFYLFQPISNPFQEKMHHGGLLMAAHFFAAGLTLMLVPIQWSSLVRKKRKILHKVSGYLYVFGVLIGGVSGLIMGFYASGGLLPQVSFIISALLWLACTSIGLYCAITKHFTAHRRWMTRSIALCASAITLRAVLGIGIGVFQMPFLDIYVIAAWAGWGLNMIICEALLFWQHRSQQIGDGNHLA